MKHCVFLAAAVCILLPRWSSAADWDLRTGDHVAYIGNTLADRMQHYPWLETLIHSRFREHELVFRNLGFSADELTVRPRSSGFGSPDSHLTRVGADVIFAFFGYNESFAGSDGLPKFRNELAQFIDHARQQRYNGQSPPRLVLFSPIAHEDLRDPHLPDGAENNKRLELYTRAMAEVAREKGVRFVDLFHPTREMYADPSHKQPLTVNGIHLTDRGYRLLAELIDRELFGQPRQQDESRLDYLRQAVLDKNLHWFNLYRTTDGYSVFGGRSTLDFVDGQTNREVMQRELEILEVMTANRDKLIWARAQGGDLTVSDDNTPEPLTVKSNKPGSGGDGRHLFLTGHAAIDRMTVAAGMKVNLFASEEQFPELVNPVQSAVDPDGRLWVAAWPSYPHWNPKEELNDKLLILPDDDGDGRADRCQVFADKLHNPTGFEFWGGGVLVAQAPDILFLKDTDGDDVADVRQRILHGIDSADTHHTANSFVIGPAGWLYFQRGVFHVTNVESPWGPPLRSGSTGMYRFDPRSHRLEMHFSIGPNPHGDVFDRWGYQFATDGTSGNGYYIGFPGRGAPKTLFQKRVRPVPAIGVLSSGHFPPQSQGNLLVCNVIGFQGVAQYEFQNQGAGFHCEEIEPIVVSSDPNFRPSDLEIGGDGALYVLDWHNPLIGHMQHNLRDPSRDHLHGRVYRVTAEGRPLLQPVKMAGRPVAEVLQHLTSTTNAVRYRARLELSGRDSQLVAAEAARWAQQFDEASGDHAQPLVEALWLHQQHRVANADLLQRVLRSPEPNARAAATRVLRDWLDKLEDAGSLLVSLAADPHPRVRAEAIVAAVSYDGPEQAEVIFTAERLPLDQQLTFVLSEAKKSIDVDRHIRQALAQGGRLSPAAAAYALKNAPVDDLLKMQRNQAVYEAILTRENVPVEHLRDALAGLAQLRGQPPLKILLSLIEDLNRRQQVSSLSSLSQLLADQPLEQLRGVGDQLRRLATEAQSADARRVALAAWIGADGGGDEAFALAARSKRGLHDVLEAAPLVNLEVRRQLYEHIQPLLLELPESLPAEADDDPEQRGLVVDFFYPSASDVARETLAQMKPQASGVARRITINVPQRLQSDQFALRFTGTIDIREAGTYTFFTNSDDGSRLYVGDELVVDNDGLHGMRERQGSIDLAAGRHGLTVTYFDNGGGDGLRVSWSGPGFGKQRIPASRLSVPAGDTLHDAAIRALSAVPGRHSDKFRDLTAVVRRGKHVRSAVAALRQLPQDDWPADQLAPLADGLAAHIAATPPEYRTSKPLLDALALADALADALPDPAAGNFRQRLDALRIRILPIGTVPHRMIYDREIIAVQAGRAVEFAFSNSDNMPHNLAVLEPGALEEVGLLAEATAQDADAARRHYIPESDRILVASRLLQPGQSQALRFQAPDEPGIYPFVCTYPGHWRRMYGALHVVADLQHYQADPPAYLAANGLVMKDSMLKYLSRNTEWKYDDLAADISQLGHGRSYEVGRQLFKVAACASCHRLNDEGQPVGPDLAKLDPPRKPEEILRDVLEPSKKVDEKYRSQVFMLNSGKIITGLVLEENDEVVKVVADPLQPDKPAVIQKSEIARRKTSELSIMPQGVLNKLTRAEILDLLAYVYARGDKEHQLFGEHQH